MSDYKLDYDGESGGPFVEGELLTFTGGEVAELVLLYDNGAEGEMYISLISGSVPADNDTITGGTSGATAAVNGTPFLSRFPVKIRDDISYNASQDIRWTGPAIGTTHSCLYDGEASGPFTVGEILTFSGGSTAELIALTDNGTDGELFFRMIDVDLPVDNETITGGTSGATANVDGTTKIRAYTPNNVHYWLSDKGDDAAFVGDDVQDRTLPRASRRVGVTDVEFLGLANIDDTMSYHMYGGSMTQASGDTEYNAVSCAVVDVDGATEPVIIQDNGSGTPVLLSAATTEYWNNAYMPNAASRVNLVIKVRDAGTTIDRRVVRFRALEEFRQYFTAPDPTLSGGITPVSLVATDDGNHTNDASLFGATATFGLQQVDHNNGNGAKDYWMVISDNGDTKTQVHERFKWEQRRGTSETIYGFNQQIIVGNDLTITYDTEAGGPFTEGEILTFGGNSSGTALLLALDDQGTTGTLYCQRFSGDVPLDNATITGGTSAATAAVNGAPTSRLIINNLVGTYTGSAFNPANIGITLIATDADTNDLFQALDETFQQPPNNQQGQVGATIGDTITVSPYDGTATDAAGDPEPDFDRLTVNGAVTGAAVTTITVNESIPTWAPQTGFLRLTTTSGRRRLVAYTSFSGNDFTIPSTDFSGGGDDMANGAGVMPSPLDQVTVASITSFTGVYTADQDGDGSGDQQFVIKVFNGSGAVPKQPSLNNIATFGPGGFAVNVTLQDD